MNFTFTQKIFISFVLLLNTCTHTFAGVHKNQKCPASEKVDKNDLMQLLGKYLEPHHGGQPFAFPLEIIEAANDTNTIKVPCEEYFAFQEETLAILKRINDKIDNVRDNTNSHAEIVGTLITMLPPSAINKPNNTQETIRVTEKNLIKLLSCLRCGETVLETSPIQYRAYILINNKPFYLSSTIKEFLLGYRHYEDLLLDSWIRCKGKEGSQLYYWPQHISNKHYKRKYGPRFREILCEGDQKEGVLAKYYDFNNDPAYQKEPLKSLREKLISKNLKNK